MRITALPLALVLGACLTPRPAALPAAPLSFIEDDYPRALAQARDRRVPLFVDAWAPW